MMGGELDIEHHDALLRYLRKTKHLGSREAVLCSTLQGGVSNRTVLVERPNGESWVIKQALPKLRVAEDWFSNPERSHREALGLIWLARLAPPDSITPLVFEDRAHHLLAMQAVPRPHENWKTRLLAGDVKLDYVVQFGELLGTIHRRARELQNEVALVFNDRTFFETLRLEPYYRFSTVRNPAATDFLHELISDTLATRVTLVHGDYSPKNFLIHHEDRIAGLPACSASNGAPPHPALSPGGGEGGRRPGEGERMAYGSNARPKLETEAPHEGRLVLLDHEVIHFGDPAFDLGFSLTHLLSKAHHFPARRADFLQAARWFWEAYRQIAGEIPHLPGLESRAVRHTVACLLARVDGRSPLEYLTPAERDRQREIVLSLISDLPGNVLDLIDDFGKKLSTSP